MVRRADRSWVSAGRSPSFSARARYLALVPKTVTRSLATMVQSASGVGANGAPSYSTTVAPTADRKSTRLNSSHTVISYAVFRFKKNNHTLHDAQWLAKSH